MSVAICVRISACCGGPSWIEDGGMVAGLGAEDEEEEEGACH
jgi:hypothetical protein